LDVQDTFFWTVSLNGYMIGGTEYSVDSAPDVILDTGTSLGYVDKSTGKKLVKSIVKGKTHFKFRG
jgi:hypothetical protein